MIVLSMKTCTKCGETKPLESFGPHKRSADGRNYWCRVCNAAARRERYAKNPKKEISSVQNWRAQNEEAYYWLQRKYSWSLKGILDIDTLDWEAFIESQDYKCFVCGSSIDAKTAHRDHDHETGLTRAAVCGTKCNKAMDKMSD